MKNDLLQALISSGMKPAAASRVAAAISRVASQGAASQQQRSASFSRPKGVGFQPVSGDKDTFALYASAAGTYYTVGNDNTLFGPGGGALGVDGVSVFNGDIYCADSGSFGGMAVRGNLAVGGSAVATTITAGAGLACGSAMTVSALEASFSVPVRASATLAVSGDATLDGDATLNGPLAINGPVVWGGLNRVPFDGLTVLTAAVANGGDTLSLTPTTVSVLNNFGQGKARDVKHEFIGEAYALTDLIEFDAEACEIVLKATDPNGNPWGTEDGNPPKVLVGGQVKITIS